MNAFRVVRDFEQALCEYTGAPYAVAVNSCTMALLLACAYAFQRKPITITEFDAAGGKAAPRILGAHEVPTEMKPLVSIPKRTYVGVPMSIIHAGGRPAFRDEEWLGCYQLTPLPVWDCARWFTSGLWRATHIPGTSGPWFGAGAMVCVSFHASKTLGDTQGGAILHDSPEADAWLRRARFDGRAEGVAPKDDVFTQIGWHCYLSPDVATRLLWKLSALPQHNDPLPNDDYPDLSQLEAFR